MTDLIQAIAELRRDGPEDATWTASLVADGNPYQSSLAGAVATTLNAALSGDLIPKADADLAVALMVEKAARLIISFPGGTVMHSPPQLLTEAHDAVMGLVSASALADLQALRDDVTGWISNAQVAREKWSEYEARAEAAEAELVTLRAQVDRLMDAAEALGAMPEGYCFCSRNRIGDDSKTHEPECADLRAAITEGAAP